MVDVAFLVAWNATSFQSARLLGLVILSFDLSDLGVKYNEVNVFRLGLGILTGTMIRIIPLSELRC